MLCSSEIPLYFSILVSRLRFTVNQSVFSFTLRLRCANSGIFLSKRSQIAFDLGSMRDFLGGRKYKLTAQGH